MRFLNRLSVRFSMPAIRHLVPVLAAAVLLTRCSCDLFGVAGALLISEQDETQVGTEFNLQLSSSDSAKSEYPIYVPKTKADTVFRDYVVNLAQEVLDGIPKDEKPSYKFKFTLIDKDVENAFAVPGGYVYIYTGIIKKMENESELAGVLGHEIAHVTQHHYRDAMAKQAGLSLLVQALVDDNSSQITQLVAGSLFSLASLKVSRGNESEADHYGTIYLGNTGRNPLGIATFFDRMKDASLDWTSTHPAPATRVEDVKAEVKGSATLNALADKGAANEFADRFLLNTRVIR
jgi:beta-barrel assembly-enhancing protease